MPRHLGRVERVGRMNGRGSPRPGWLAALPSPPDGGEEDGDEDEAGRMADRRGAALPFPFAFVLSLYIIRYII